jgi:hypothetical protein
MRIGIWPPGPLAQPPAPCARACCACSIWAFSSNEVVAALTLGTARARLELPHQGVFSVGERGHRLTERRPPFLGEDKH